MDERVLRARKFIKLMQWFFIVLTIGIDASLFRFGVSYGIYKTIISIIPLVATISMFDSVLSGKKNSLYKMCFFLLLGILYIVYIIFSTKDDIRVILTEILLGLVYLVQCIYLLLSKDIKSFFTYNDEVKSFIWMWNWKGTCIGYKHDDYLWSSEGENIGKFIEKEIYSPEGKYLGELHTNGRLGIDKGKIEKTSEPYEMSDIRKKYEEPQDKSPLILYHSFLDFSIQINL